MVASWRDLCRPRLYASRPIGRWRTTAIWRKTGRALAPMRLSKGLPDLMTIDHPLVDVVRLKPLEGFRLWVRFSDGREGVADLSAVVARSGAMVAALKDPAYFDRVFIEAGVPTWPNGYDFGPSALYVEMRDAGALQPVAAE